MKQEITDIVTTEDRRRIQSMVIHQYSEGKSNLHPDVVLQDGNYRIDGISHLSEQCISLIKTQCCAVLMKEIICTEWNLDKRTAFRKEKVLSVERIASTGDHVYDISMGGLNHYFFANNILVHNTDSVYFSVAHHYKEQNIPFDFSKDEVVDLYIQIGDTVGESFPSFMNEAFNTGIEKGKIVGADLEMVGSRGLFLKKKRYAILKYWEDGFRKDVDGSPGEIKAMGLEIKRSDTPKYIQEFLEEVLIALLVGETETNIRNIVRAFKKEFSAKPSIDKGSPKTVKKLTHHTEIYQETGKCGVGHVLAAIQWNRMRDAMEDRTVPEAVDGSKIIVCKLKNNPYNIKTIGYPLECKEYLPEWFLELPFDAPAMELAVLTKKLENIFGILKMDIAINESSDLVDNGFFTWK